MSAWLEACRAVAREAALREDRARAGVADGARLPAFAYRWEHVQQVAANGRWLLTQVEADAEVVLAACWLHDVRKEEPEHARRGAEFARAFLPESDFPPHKIEAVADAIAQHEGLMRPAAEWSKEAGEPFRPAPPLRPIEAGLLWDADKLSKVGPLAFLHYLPAHLLDLHARGEATTTDALIARNRRWLDTLAPRLIASFNTVAAQRKAMQLHAATESFWASAEQAVRTTDERRPTTDDDDRRPTTDDGRRTTDDG